MQDIHEQEELRRWLAGGASLANCALQAVDLTGFDAEVRRADVQGCLLLGCNGPAELFADVQARGGIVLPRFSELPFSPFTPHLYRPEELFAGFDPREPCSYCDTMDARIYQYWLRTGRSQPSMLIDTLARRLHDFSMSDAVEDFLAPRSKPVVAIMGGHNLGRDDPAYAEVVELSAMLTRSGHLMTSGGGPGAMEATHLGAHLCRESPAERSSAIQVLAKAPTYRDERWLSQAFEVLARFPQRDEDNESLGIPTWLYGHEPPNPFASHIAKYFANSVREEGLVTIAKAGIVFAPGSAGTIQEVFQDATQNHYGSVGWISPMVFLDSKFWTETKPVYPLLRQLAQGRQYGGMLGVVDTAAQAAEFLRLHPPQPAEGGDWSYCGEFCEAEA